jgi:CubicO group peptidase (beta-lactamase class C family)
VFLSVALPARPAAAAPDDSPAARRVRELVDVINASDRAGSEKFVRENYGPEFLKMPMDAHLGFLADAYGRTRGLEVESVDGKSPTEASATVRSKLTGERMDIIVQVEAEPPHRITGIGRRPAKARPGEGADRKLTEQQAVQELKAQVQKLADADAFSGVVLLAKDGKPILLSAWGEANKDFGAPNRADTKFNLGSMNKMFTAVATLQLVERGRLSLDDSLSKFLPDFPNKDAAEKIRVKHLLSHTSGLGSYFNQKFEESSRARWRTVDQMLELAKDEKPQFEPGEKWAYSNTGFLVLGKVIEKVTGQDYYDYVRDNVYRPAGMTATDCYELDRVNPNLAVGYQGNFGKDGVVWRNNLFEHVIRGGPAGGGYSTAEDLLRFDRALRGGKLLGPQYVKMALSAKPDLKSSGYGFGFQIQQSQGTAVAGHGGG